MIMLSCLICMPDYSRHSRILDITNYFRQERTSSSPEISSLVQKMIHQEKNRLGNFFFD